VGTLSGRIPPVRDYYLYHCQSCHFSFISNYRTDYDVVYNEDYYQGRGADPLVNYRFDHLFPKITLRRLEWEGLREIFLTLTGNPAATWLDYGTGLGSLVQFGREKGLNIFGFEPYQKEPTHPTQEDLAPFQKYLLPKEALTSTGPFDFVTAIEVIEHAPDPVAFLKDIRPLLKEGGTLFLTTGNAWPYRHKLTSWSYTNVPDVHMSFFEPQTLCQALEKAGFKPQFPGYVKGFTRIIQYKILKNLGFKKRHFLFNLIPWPIVSRLADSRFHVTAHPVGRASN
jgi:2-polyprenyl-3-methyl-5-hydroxy-6-metoxy-1,4-benzoquinol methylase